jgi:tetratricopeptide (TPR) repeat protein
MEFDPETVEPSEIEAINKQASVLMKRGIALMNDPQPGNLEEALDHFDRALRLRANLPVDRFPLLRYGLAACWLNRADALTRLDSVRISHALFSYDEGIRLLRGLTLNDDARFPRRLAIAYQNRGLALRTQGPSGVAGAVSAFNHAIAVLGDDSARTIPDRQYLLAAVYVNLANTRAAEGTAESGPLARDATRHALELIADLEGSDADAAEVGLTARHVVCQTLAARLSEPVIRGEKMPDDVHEATDIVDDGLALVRSWEQKGVSRFRNFAYDLFRFGARVYARYQPHFVGEFVLENLDPGRSSKEYVESPEMRSAAHEALGL